MKEIYLNNVQYINIHIHVYIYWKSSIGTVRTCKLINLKVVHLDL